MNPEPASRVSSDRSKRRALAILAFFVGSTVLFFMAAPTDDALPSAPATAGATTDLDVFRRTVERVHQGERYYDAAGRELRAHGYPTSSMFNWRLPLYAWLHGALPSLAWGRAILIGLAAATLFLWCGHALEEKGVFTAAAQGVLLIGALGWCVGPEETLFTELWAGTLIALSAGAYARGWRSLGVAAGLLALFDRELALPYVLVATGLALARGRRREALIWAIGLALFGLVLLEHGVQVSRRITDASPASASSWIRFGGARFVLTMARMNILVMLLPAGWTAIYLGLALLGLATGRGETSERTGLTVGIYVAAFAIVGHPFNAYWGFVIAPLLTAGVVRSPTAIRALVADLSERPTSLLVNVNSESSQSVNRNHARL